jgi:hypothetical protein
VEFVDLSEGDDRLALVLVDCGVSGIDRDGAGGGELFLHGSTSWNFKV